MTEPHSAHRDPHGSRIDRRTTARKLLDAELDKLPPEERVAVERFIHRRHVSRNVAREYASKRSLGERVADRA